MADDKHQLVDEGAMEKMSVAPPDPEAGQDGGGSPETLGAQGLMNQLKGSPGELRPDHDAGADAAQPGQSSVADEDPLSAHPS